MSAGRRFLALVLAGALTAGAIPPQSLPVYGKDSAAEPGRRISAADAAKAEIFFDEPVSEGAIHGSGSGFNQGWNAADIWQQLTLTYTVPVR